GQRGRTWEVNCYAFLDAPRLLVPGETKFRFDGDIVDGIVKSDNEDGTNRDQPGTSRLSAGGRQDVLDGIPKQTLELRAIAAAQRQLRAVHVDDLVVA